MKASAENGLDVDEVGQYVTLSEDVDTDSRRYANIGSLELE